MLFVNRKRIELVSILGAMLDFPEREKDHLFCG